MVWWVEVPACNPGMNLIVGTQGGRRELTPTSYPLTAMCLTPHPPRTDNKIKTMAFSINKKTNMIKCGKAVN